MKEMLIGFALAPFALIGSILFILGMGLLYEWAHKGRISLEDEARSLNELEVRAKYKAETGRDLFEKSK